MSPAPRVWDRSSVNSTSFQIDTGESSGAHIEMNSETQPWGLEAWLQYNLYWEHTLDNGNFPLYVDFANEQDVLENVHYGVPTSLGSTPVASTTALIVNGTGKDSVYVFTAGSSPNDVPENGVSISGSTSYYQSIGGPLNNQYYIGWSSQLDSLDNFTVIYLSTGGGTSGSSCSPASSPTISSGPIYARIGMTTQATLTLSNAGNNVSVSVETLTFSSPLTDLQIDTTAQSVATSANAGGSNTIPISVDIGKNVPAGEYNVTGQAVISETCGSSTIPGQIGFTLQIVAQNQVKINRFDWLTLIEQWWWAIVILAIVVIGGGVVAFLRRGEFGS